MDELTKYAKMLQRMAGTGLTRKEAAFILDVPYTTVYKTIRRFGIEEGFNRNGNAKKSRDKRRQCVECRRWAKP